MEEKIPPDLFDFLEKQDWDRLYAKLVGHAVRRMKLMGLPLEGANGFDPEAVVTDAVTKVFTGIRKPTKKNLLDFEYYMGSVVNSLIYSLKVSKGNTSNSNEDVETISDESFVEFLFDEGFLNELEVKNTLDRIGNQLVDENEDEMYMVYCEMRIGGTNIEIADALGIDVSNVERIKKKLVRYFEKVRKSK